MPSVHQSVRSIRLFRSQSRPTFFFVLLVRSFLSQKKYYLRIERLFLNRSNPDRAYIRHIVVWIFFQGIYFDQIPRGITKQNKKIGERMAREGKIG